jgi:hypothetical protein
MVTLWICVRFEERSGNGVARLYCSRQVTIVAASKRNYVHNYLLDFLIFCSVIEKFVDSISIFTF